ncbi:MAG TPA: hypothetical protein VGJ13_05240 [Pseudonocardiaceae bacterium]|jgi:hypothetical protein
MAVIVRTADGDDTYPTATDWVVDAHHQCLTVLDTDGQDAEVAVYPAAGWLRVCHGTAPGSP